jgi:aldose 1-epimerase
MSEKMAKLYVLCCFIVLSAFEFVNDSAKKEEIRFYELKKGDISMNFTNWSGTIVSLHLPGIRIQGCVCSSTLT